MDAQLHFFRIFPILPPVLVQKGILVTSNTYDFVFVSKERAVNRKPHLGIKVKRESFASLIEVLKELSSNWEGPIQAYLDTKRKPKFRFGPRGKSGYGLCARVERSREEICYYFPLTLRKRKQIVVSVSVLLRALSILATKNGEATQALEVFTSFGNEWYGHSLVGTIHPSFGAILEGLASENPRILTEKVVGAMKETWWAVADTHLKLYVTDCSFHLHPDGRPSFGCFGDACDLAVYPDGMIISMTEAPAQLNCHNLDLAAQQLTLLAGLAQLYYQSCKSEVAKAAR
jgi:hypothetical protein